MKKTMTLAIIVGLSLLLCGCGYSRSVSGDRDGADGIRVTLSELAGCADLGLNVPTRGISVTDVEAALSYLDMYIYGDYVSKKDARDSIEYLKRYVEAVDDKFSDIYSEYENVFY